MSYRNASLGLRRRRRRLRRSTFRFSFRDSDLPEKMQKSNVKHLKIERHFLLGDTFSSPPPSSVTLW